MTIDSVAKTALVETRTSESRPLARNATNLSRQSLNPASTGRRINDPWSEEMASCSKLNPFNFADCDLVLGSVVELSGPGRLMRAHREFAGEFVRRTWVQAQGLLP